MPGSEVENLRARLAEAEETLEAIRSGGVDALVVRGKAGDEIYTLTSADRVFRELAEEMSDGAATISDEGTILWANEQLAQLLGQRLELIMGSNLDRFASDAVITVLEAGRHEKQSGEVDIRRIDGTLVPVRLSVAPVSVEGLVARAVVATDLTEHRRTEEMLRASASEAEQVAARRTTELATSRLELRQAQERTRALLDAVAEQLPVGIVVADPAGQVVYMNALALDYWSLVQSAGGGTRARGGDPAWEPIPASEAVLERALAGERVEGKEVEIRRSEGEPTTVLVRAEPVHDANGAVIGAVCAIVDITARRAQEAMRDAFIDVTAHELKTPLTVVYGITQRMVTHEVSLDAATRRELVADVAGESERLVHLVDDMLVLSRIERGSRFVTSEPLSLGHLVEEFVGRRSRRRAAAQVRVTVLNPLPVVSGERAYVEQILENLLRNADKYGLGPVEVVVEAADGGAAMRVLDRGPGFTGDAETLFHLYYREPGASKRAGGAGIGLFVCRELAKMMGGRVWAANRPDGGAEFGLFLPAYVEEP